MMHLLKISAILITLFSAQASGLICDLSQVGSDPGTLPDLSPYWAQEIIGADLAKEHLKALSKHTDLKAVRIADIDGGVDWKSVTATRSGNAVKELSGGPFSGHGSAVINLLAGKGRYGVGLSPFVSISDFIPSYFNEAQTQALMEKDKEKIEAGVREAQRSGLREAMEKYNSINGKTLSEMPDEVRSIQDVLEEVKKNGWNRNLYDKWQQHISVVRERNLSKFKQSDPEAFALWTDHFEKFGFPTPFLSDAVKNNMAGRVDSSDRKSQIQGHNSLVSKSIR